MNATHLIDAIESAGTRLRVEGDRLMMKAEQPLPDPLLVALRDRKAEIVSTLRERPTVSTAVPGSLESRDMPAMAADVAEMPLDDFQNAGLALPFFSTVLNEEVVFASDNAVIDPGERRVVYCAAELWHMREMSPNLLRSAHEVKRIFGGTIGPN